MGLGLPVLIMYTFLCFRSLFFGALFLLSTFAVKAVSVRYRRGGGPANNGGRLSQAFPPTVLTLLYYTRKDGRVACQRK